VPLLAQQSSDPSQPSAQQPQVAPDEIIAVPNRPTIASTAEAVQRGVLEVEYGFEGGDGHQNINGLVKFGIFQNLELRFANNPFQRDDGVSGTGDSAAGFKWRFLRQSEGWRPTMSFLYAGVIPTANHGLGFQASGHAFQLLVSKDLGKHHFDFNEGIQLVGRPEPGASGFDRNYFTALSYSHPIRGKWGFTAEIAGYSWTNQENPATMTLLFAPTYSPVPRLVLDAGAYVAAYGNLPRVTFFFGATWAISDLYRAARH